MRERILDWGVTSWRLVGILLAVLLTYLALVAFSGLVIPLLFATVAAALGVPFVDRLERASLPRPLGALILIALLVGVVVIAAVILVRGILDESAEIKNIVVAGAESLRDWVGSDPDPSHSAATYDSTVEQGWPWFGGAASWATTIFSSAMACAIGVFLGMFMLYYLLVDWGRVTTWLSRHLGLDPETGAAVIGDATTVVRRGFGAMTLTSLITSGLIGLVMLFLDLPLALSVTIVTFVTSYVPYFGAVISGVFGFLVALGAGGTRDAIVLLIVILIVQNVVQTLVSNRLSSEALKLHPLPSIISSVAGVAVAGLVGAIVSAPILALALAVNRRLDAAHLQPARTSGSPDAWSTRAAPDLPRE